MRGQAHTLEGVAAALVVVLSVVFALQVTAVTPLTASTASQHIENQERAAAAGVLATAADNGSLSSTLRYWNETNGTFHNATGLGYYASAGPPTAFGAHLNETFLERGIAFNVYVHYRSGGGERKTRTLVHLGEPSDNAVSASRIVTLYDDDRLYAANHTLTNATLANASYFARDRDPASHVYQVVEVEVVAWRM